MKINKFLKIALFVTVSSILFTACANKSPNKNIKKVEKTKIQNINNILNDPKLFEYDSRLKLYKNKSTQEQNRKNLLLRFADICSQKKGKLVYINYFINKTYVNSYINNKAYICEVDNAPYFIGHVASKNTNSYLSISIDENIKKEYLNTKTNFETIPSSSSDTKFEATLPSQVSVQEDLKEREEIQKRERARERKTKQLFNKNQTIMTFFDSWRQTGKDSLCPTKCKSINKRSTGFTTLKEATDNKWQIVSKMGETSETIDETCTCTGSSVVLKKISSEDQASK